MLLRYSLDMAGDAEKVEAAVLRVLEKGYRTADIRQDGTTGVGTREMGDLIARELSALYS
jgi:3-isopropylmalate dehydrogenase